ncbi:LysR substrate-binding domain-containing protein [Bradyrhizobium sp. USDA 3262]
MEGAEAVRGAQLRYVRIHQPVSVDQWLIPRHRRHETALTRIRRHGNSMFTQPMVKAAIAGYGIAYVPEETVTDAVASGLLQLVLDDWSPKFSGYYLYYPSGRQNSPAFKVIVDALRHHGK